MKLIHFLLALAIVVIPAAATSSGSLEMRANSNITNLNNLTFDSSGDAIDFNDRGLTGVGGIGFNGTAPTVTDDVLYSDTGTLKWGGNTLGQDAGTFASVRFSGGNAIASLNGKVISSGTNNTTVIQAAVTAMHAGKTTGNCSITPVVLLSKFVMPWGITTYPDVPIWGADMSSTGMTIGNVTCPLITIGAWVTSEERPTVMLQDIYLYSESTTDPTVNSTPISHFMYFDRVFFQKTSSNTTSLKLYSWRYGSIKNCRFYGGEDIFWSGTAIETWNENTAEYSDLSCTVEGNEISHYRWWFKGTAHSSSLVFENNQCMGTNYGVHLYYANDVRICNNLLEGTKMNAVRIDSAFFMQINHNYASSYSGVWPVILVSSISRDTYYANVHGNQILNELSTNGTGVEFATTASYSIVLSTIDGNTMHTLGTGIAVTDGGVDPGRIDVTHNRVVSCTTGISVGANDYGIITGNNVMNCGTSDSITCTACQTHDNIFNTVVD